jgi:hypothetical protein
MLRYLIITIALFLISGYTFSQDSLYTRQIIQYLTSKDCFGRGYVNSGLHTAEKFIQQEIKKLKVLPLFGTSFTQAFTHQVNTFPSRCEVSIDKKKLIPGQDYILNPGSSGIKGHFDLKKIDSAHFIGNSNRGNVSLEIKNKLTFGVSNQTKSNCEIELKKISFSTDIKCIDVDVKNILNTKFKSKNIGACIEGLSGSDSCIVFSAHYDHLGGMGSQTFFPGANDNASGVSMVLNLIKYYAVNPPKYKTVFIFFAAEEAGLLGSKYFVESKVIDLKKIKFLINLDLLGTGDGGIMVVNGAIHEKAFATLSSLNEQTHFVKQIKKRGKAANSDHYWFSEANVPCFFIYTMGGITAYHDIYDIEKTLPLSAYKPVFKLIISFVETM